MYMYVVMYIFDYPNRLQIANLVILINLYFERFHTVLEMGSEADWWVFLKMADLVHDLFCNKLIKIKLSFRSELWQI